MNLQELYILLITNNLPKLKESKLNRMRQFLQLTFFLAIGVFGRINQVLSQNTNGNNQGGFERRTPSPPVDPDSPVESYGATPKEALLVGEKDAGRLVIIDPESLEIVARIPVGGNLHELATDGRYVYMGSRLPGITVVDAVAQKRVESIDISPFGRPHAITFAGTHLYIGHEESRLISRYNPIAKKFDEVIGLPGGSHLLIVTPDEKRIYTASSNGQLISIIDKVTPSNGSTSLSFTSFPGDTRMEGMTLSPDGNEFWVLHMNQKKISVINVPEKKLMETIEFEGSLNNRIKFSSDGKYVFLNELNGNELRVYEASIRKEIKRIDVGAGGEGIFMDPVRPRAYYAVSAGNKLVVIDTNTLTVIKEIHGLMNPDGMDWYSAK